MSNLLEIKSSYLILSLSSYLILSYLKSVQLMYSLKGKVFNNRNLSHLYTPKFCIFNSPVKYEIQNKNKLAIL